MASSTELLEAIVAAPNDDAPRLVYADWLLEHDPSREKLAHTIIAQCTIAACEAQGDRRSVEYRRARHAEARLDLPPNYTWPFRVGVLRRGPFRRRGFPTHLYLPLEPTTDFLPGLPLEGVYVTKDGGVTVADLRPAYEIGKRSPVREVGISCAFGKASFDAAGLFALFDEGLADAARVWTGDVVPHAPFFEHVVSLQLREGASTQFTPPRHLRRLHMTGEAIDVTLLYQVPALDHLEVWDAREDEARDVIETLKTRVGARLSSLALTSFHWRESSALPHVWSKSVGNDFVEAGLRDGLAHLTASFSIDAHTAMASYETLVAAGGFDEGAMGALGPELHDLVAFRLHHPEELADAWLIALSDLTLVGCDLTSGALEKLACDRLSELSSLQIVRCKYGAPDDARALLHSPKMASVPNIRFGPELWDESFKRNYG